MTDLAGLDGRRFDLVVDTSGFAACTVGASSVRLAEACERYVFVSSASVYPDWPGDRVTETSRVFDDPAEGDGHGEGKACRAATGADARFVWVPDDSSEGSGPRP